MPYDLIKLMKTAREISGVSGRQVHIGLSPTESRVTLDKDDVEDMPVQLYFKPAGRAA